MTQIIRQEAIPDQSAATHEVVCIDDYRAFRALALLLGLTLRVDLKESTDHMVYREAHDEFGRQMGSHVMFADAACADAGHIMVPVHLTTPTVATEAKLLEPSKDNDGDKCTCDGVGTCDACWNEHYLNMNEAQFNYQYRQVCRARNELCTDALMNTAWRNYSRDAENHWLTRSLRGDA